MKNLTLVTLVLLGSTAFAQQKTEANSEVKSDPKTEASKNEQPTTVESKKIKTISPKDAQRIPLVKPGKRNTDPAKKD